MRKVNGTAWGCGFFTLLLATYLAWCYFEVAAQHRYAPKVAQTISGVTGARIVSSFKSGDLANPVSWFWPATTRLVYARPDTSVSSPRFFIMSFGIDDPVDEQPAIMLYDVDCKSRSYHTYFPEKRGDTGPPALTALGEPLMAPNGTRFLQHDTGIDPSPELVKALCDADWSKEAGRE